MAKAAAAKPKAEGLGDAAPTCGVIMPISDSASHKAAHWAEVQTLLHRAIASAGMRPHNVWEGTEADKITSRILSNLFADPIAVCDISDLNANVMLELGMRLSSKKPTIVVREEGARIPFDIADFQTLSYPADLTMLPMERFMDDLAQMLQAKLAAVDDGTYRAFLADVEIEFLEPSARAVPFDQLVTSQLERLSQQIDSLRRRLPDQRLAARFAEAGRMFGGAPAGGIEATLRDVISEAPPVLFLSVDHSLTDGELAILSDVPGVLGVSNANGGVHVVLSNDSLAARSHATAVMKRRLVDLMNDRARAHDAQNPPGTPPPKALK